MLHLLFVKKGEVSKPFFDRVKPQSYPLSIDQKHFVANVIDFSCLS